MLPPKLLPSKYMPLLDVLRFLAVVLVMMHHTNAVRLPGGGIGVDIFFAISGFLIIGLLGEEYIKKGSINFLKFYGRRIIRLLPALWTMLAITVFFIKPDVYTLISILFYFSNWLLASEHKIGFYGHTWSLSVEEQFYIVLPVILLMILKTSKVFGAKFKLVITIGLGILCSASVIGRVYLIWVGELDYAYNSTGARAGGFLLGGMAAIYAQEIQNCLRKFGLGILGAISLFFIFKYALTHHIYSETVDVIVIPFLCVFLVLWASIQNDKHFLNKKILVYPGTISYGIYLWHYPLIGLLPEIQPKFIFIVIFILSMAVASLSWHFIEKLFSRKFKPLFTV